MKKLILTSFLLLIFSAFPLNTFAGDSSHCTPPGELGGADYCPGQDYWSGACQDRVTCDSGYSFSCSQGQCCFDNDDGTFNQITDPINDGTTCSAIHRSFNGCAAPSVCKNQCTSGWEKDPAIAWSSVDACRPKCASYEVRVGDACVFESTLIYSESQFKADTAPGSPYVGVGGGAGGSFLDIKGYLTGDAGAHSDQPIIRLTQGTDTTYNIGDVHSEIQFYTEDIGGNYPGVQAYIKAVTTRGSVSNPDVGLVFGAGNAGVNPETSTDRMIIKHNGNVGIGTTSPHAQLHLTEDIAITRDDFRFSFDNKPDMIAENDDGFLLIPVDNGGNDSDLRLYIEDDPDDSFSIWGNSCDGGECWNLDESQKLFEVKGSGHAFFNSDIRMEGYLYDEGSLDIASEKNIWLIVDSDDNDTGRSIKFGSNDWDSPTELMRIEEDGDVIIQDYLDVGGDLDVGDDLDVADRIYGKGGTFFDGYNIYVNRIETDSNVYVKRNTSESDSHARVYFNSERARIGWNGSEYYFQDGNGSGEKISVGSCGGCGDIAEYASVSKNEPLESGDVVVIDVNSEEQFAKSIGPFSENVAGVYSSTPGIYMGLPEDGISLGGEDFTQKSSLEHNGTIPLALAGQVPVKVTDENGPISKGDLLTTSSTPGYAMKWTLLDISGANDFEHITGKSFYFFFLFLI